MTRGPAMQEPTFRREDEFDTAFRVVSSYYIGMDGWLMRLDAKIGDEQVNSAFYVRRGENSLKMPQGSYIGESVRVNRQDLVKALRDMADDIEQVSK